MISRGSIIGLFAFPMLLFCGGLSADELDGVNTATKGAAKRNFIFNPSFEGDGVFLKGNSVNSFCLKDGVARWETRDMDCVSIDSGVFHEGGRSLRVKGSPSRAVAVQQSVILVGTEPVSFWRGIYNVSGWIRTENLKAEARITSDGFPGSLSVSGLKEGGAWTFFSKDISLFDGNRLDLLLVAEAGEGTAWFDDISVTRKENPSKNLLSNSGFWFCANKNVPNYWGTYASGAIKDFTNVLKVEEPEGLPLQNVRCLKIENPAPSICLYYTTANLPGDRDYVFSAYLKASSGAGDVSVEVPGEKAFKVNGEWTRYHAKFNLKRKPHGREIYLKLVNSGTVWIAAPQLENGDVLTEYEIPLEDSIKKETLASAIPLERPIQICLPMREGGTESNPGDEYVRLLPQYPFYTEADKESAVSMKWNLKEKTGFSAKARDVDGKEYPLGSKFELSGRGEKIVSLPIESLPNGEYRLEFRHDSNRKIDVAKEALCKFPSNKIVIRANRFLRMLEVNSRLFPVVNIYYPHRFVPDVFDKATFWQLEDIKEKGFNTINIIAVLPPLQSPDSLCAQMSETEDIRNVKAILDKCEALGLKAIPDFYCRKGSYLSTRSRTLAFIESLKTHPAVLAWMIVDEPEFWWEKGGQRTPYDLADLYRSAKQIDPYHPVYINDGSWNEGGSYSSPFSDIVSVDRYPFYIWPSSIDGYVGYQAYMMNSHAVKQGKPAQFYVQIYGYWEGTREPAKEEAELMTFQNIVFGARNIAYYLYKPASCELWSGMKPLIEKAERVVSLLSSPNARELVGGRKVESVYFSVWEVGGKCYLIAANGDINPANARFQFTDSLIESVETLFEHAKIDLKDNSFSFKFQPYGTAVFEIAVKK